MNESIAKFWMVYGLHLGPPRAQHQSLNSARTEADRLALLHPGDAFIVLEAIEQHEVAPIPVSVTTLVEYPF